MNNSPSHPHLNRKMVYRNLWAMNVIIHSLNEEDLMGFWMQECVPDDCRSVEDVTDCYETYEDGELASEYERYARIFAKTIRVATEKGYDVWSYVGQNAEDVKNSK